ncbi:hypothetical protein BJ165DRAFT_1517701 [Panaeolus papilionaceus]|nr:hypothetical protein BJ165DRAFT_1517701 [Panaeolus papilionaceus]
MVGLDVVGIILVVVLTASDLAGSFMSVEVEDMVDSDDEGSRMCDGGCRAEAAVGPDNGVGIYSQILSAGRD